MTRLRPEGEAVKVWGEASTEIPGWCTPTGIRWQGTPYCIRKVCTRWRVHTRWWESDHALWREYLKVLITPAVMAGSLGRGSNLGNARGELLCLLYRDLLSGDWFLARVYD